MEHFVSVIITTYRRPFKILTKALNSVIGQTHKNLEIIIVDDNSEFDLYRQEIEENVNKIKDDRIKYLKHMNNKGACQARNTGILNSTGKYIAFLDDDDEWLPEKVEMQLEKFADKKVGLVYCDSYTINILKKRNINKTVRANRISGMVYDQLILNNFVGSTSFVMVSKESLEKCGLFNENLKSAQDYELWLRIARNFKVDYVDIPLVNYYIHSGERISTNVLNRIQGLEMIIKLNKPYLNKHPKIYCKRKLDLVPFYAVRDGYSKALSKWFAAIKIYPSIIQGLKCLVKIIFYRNSYSNPIS